MQPPWNRNTKCIMVLLRYRVCGGLILSSRHPIIIKNTYLLWNTIHEKYIFDIHNFLILIFVIFCVKMINEYYI